jgi:N-acetylglucosaminyldiphosphoundecaprenol N-acetyl-beta-D-mannosaminyltransferase
MPLLDRVPEPTATARVLGVQVDGWTPDALIQAMVDSAAGALREELQRASTVYCDGTGVALASRLLGHPLPPRLTAADWIDDLCRRAAHSGVSLFLLGGEPGVAERAASRLTSYAPGLRIAGTHHGFLDEDLSSAVIARANAAGTDLMLVGMGSPIQELWIGRHRKAIHAPVVWAVGALMDFVAGTQRRAPGILRRLHLEWLWRLGTDPVRLAGRYVVGNPLFAARVLGEAFSGRSPGPETPGSG